MTKILAAVDKKNVRLELFNFGVAFLKVDGKDFIGNDPLLMIKCNAGEGYSIKTVLPGMGYAGPIKTNDLLALLKKQGFEVSARDLRKWINQ